MTFVIDTNNKDYSNTSNVSNEALPIGVFDSGIGGVSVLKSLMDGMPNERFLYLGDTARLPYGEKSPKTIKRYVEQNIRFLAKRGVKAIVIACNSASTVVQGETHYQGIPLYNVIGPGVEKALQVSKTKCIGVIATRRTIDSGLYELLLKTNKQDKNIQVTQVHSKACPLLAPMVEEGIIDGPIALNLVAHYIDSHFASLVDTLILGCTHYPLLRDVIQQVVGEQVTLVDSGSVLLELLREEQRKGIFAVAKSAENLKKVHFMATDITKQFAQTLTLILNQKVSEKEVEVVDL